MAFFTPKNTFFTSTNVIFNIITYTHFLKLFHKKTPLKIGIEGNNLHIFYETLKFEFKKSSQS